LLPIRIASLTRGIDVFGQRSEMMQPFHSTQSFDRTKSARRDAATDRPGVIFGWQWQLVIVCVALLLMIAAASARAAGGPAALLGLPSASDAARFSLNAQAPEPGVVRHRPVSVDFQQVMPNAGPAQISVELFDGGTVLLDLDRVETRATGDYTWYGRVQGHPKGHATLTVVNGRMAGAIEFGETGSHAGGSYQIQGRADGTHVIRQIEQSSFPPDHPPGTVSPMAPQAATNAGVSAAIDSALSSLAPSGATTAADNGSTIDVMVVYSNQTAAAAGSGIGAQVQQAIDTANTVYANSGISTRLRLVHSEQLNYNESGDFPTDLNWLTSNAGVASLRNSYGADLVSMFVENGQACGYGWIGPSASSAFTVINRGCASGNLSFPHEIGHNFGARHDVFVDASTTPYPYGHGWVDCAEGWRDVMAYATQCGGTRIPYLSNPNMTYGSPPDPLGNASTADNVRVHNQNAVTVANFRLASVGGCTYALSPTSASFGSVAGSGSFGVTAGTGCAWNTAISGAWLTIGAGSGTTASGTLNYLVAANLGPAHTGTITVGGQLFTVNQASGCSYNLSPTSASFAAAGGSGTTALSAAAGCAWNATSSASWLTVSSASSGTGNATISYVAGVNAGVARSANLTLGGVTFVVTQAAASIAAPVATLSALQIQFGTQQMANKPGKSSKTQSVALSNSGGGTLTINSLTPGGTNPADFVRSGTCAVGAALAAGQSCSLVYTFSPAGQGASSARLDVGTNANTVTLGLSGTAMMRGN
jgi:peptidyl-Asp metalloendopeptidase